MNHNPFGKEMGVLMRPLYIMGRVLGMTIHEMGVKGPDPKRSRRLLALKLAIQVVQMALIYLFFRSLDGPKWKGFEKASTVKFLVGFRIVSYFLIMVIVSATSNRQLARGIKSYREICKIDYELVQDFDGVHEEELFKCYRDCKKMVFQLGIIVGGGLTVLSEVLSLCVIWYDSIFFVLCLYPRLVLTALGLRFFVGTLSLEQRFKILNRLLRVKLLESRTTRMYPPIAVRNTKFTDDIQKIVKYHTSLVIVAKRLNSVFTLQILLSVTMNLVLVIGKVHTSLYIVFFNDLFQKHYKLVLEMLKNSAVCLIELLLLIWRCSRLCYEANNTKVLLVGIKIHIDKDEERDVVIASTFKLMRNKLEITACNMFNLDSSLLFSLFGAISSYVFVMLQLDMGNTSNIYNFKNFSAND